MFSFFFLSSYTLFLRMNTEQQIRSLHKHLPRTWGGAEGLTPGRSLGQGAVPIEALPAGPGRGRETARAGAEGGGGVQSRPRGPSRYLPASATVYRDRPRARSCVRTPSPIPHFMDRETETPDDGEETGSHAPNQGHPTGQQVADAGSRQLWARAPLSLRAEARPKASASDPVWRDQKS